MKTLDLIEKLSILICEWRIRVGKQRRKQFSVYLIKLFCYSDVIRNPKKLILELIN